MKRFLVIIICHLLLFSQTQLGLALAPHHKATAFSDFRDVAWYEAILGLAQQDLQSRKAIDKETSLENLPDLLKSNGRGRNVQMALKRFKADTTLHAWFRLLKQLQTDAELQDRIKDKVDNLHSLAQEAKAKRNALKVKQGVNTINETREQLEKDSLRNQLLRMLAWFLRGEVLGENYHKMPADLPTRIFAEWLSEKDIHFKRFASPEQASDTLAELFQYQPFRIAFDQLHGDGLKKLRGAFLGDKIVTQSTDRHNRLANLGRVSRRPLDDAYQKRQYNLKRHPSGSLTTSLGGTRAELRKSRKQAPSHTEQTSALPSPEPSALEPVAPTPASSPADQGQDPTAQPRQAAEPTGNVTEAPEDSRNSALKNMLENFGNDRQAIQKAFQQWLNYARKERATEEAKQKSGDGSFFQETHVSSSPPPSPQSSDGGKESAKFTRKGSSEFKFLTDTDETETTSSRRNSSSTSSTISTPLQQGLIHSKVPRPTTSVTFAPERKEYEVDPWHENFESHQNWLNQLASTLNFSYRPNEHQTNPWHPSFHTQQEGEDGAAYMHTQDSNTHAWTTTVIIEDGMTQSSKKQAGSFSKQISKILPHQLLDWIHSNSFEDHPGELQTMADKLDPQGSDGQLNSTHLAVQIEQNPSRNGHIVKHYVIGDSQGIVFSPSGEVLLDITDPLQKGQKSPRGLRKDQGELYTANLDEQAEIFALFFSDGLSNNMPQEEIIQFVLERWQNEEDLGEALVKAAQGPNSHSPQRLKQALKEALKPHTQYPLMSFEDLRSSQQVSFKVANIQYIANYKLIQGQYVFSQFEVQERASHAKNLSLPETLTIPNKAISDDITAIALHSRLEHSA